MRSLEERSSVLALAAEGLTASAIARRAQIPRSTVRAQACDYIGVHWTRMNDQAISVARRDDVTKLDTFIGPKR